MAIEQQMRLKVTRSKGRRNEITDVLSGFNPQHYDGNALRMQLGIFRDDDTPQDLTDLASLKASIVNSAGATLATKTITSASITPTITKSGFDAGTEFHGVVEFSNVDLDFALTADRADYRLTIWGLDSSGDEVTFGTGTWTQYEDWTGGTVDDPPGPDVAITADDAVGLFESRVGLVLPFEIAVGQKTALVTYGPTFSSPPTYWGVPIPAFVHPDVPEIVTVDTETDPPTTTELTVKLAVGNHATPVRGVVIVRIP